MAHFGNQEAMDMARLTLGPAPRVSRKRPAAAMTKGIQTTYNTITDRLRREATLAAADREARPGGKYNHGYDDKNFDYIAALPEEFGGRYVLLEAIGTGSFSKVYRARDLHNDGALVALKVVKSKAEFMAQAQAEVELLQRLLRHDPHGRHHCTRLLDSFWHRGHQCLVFELLHGSLYELLDDHNFQGFNLSAVRKFAWHVLTALAFLARPEVDVIHADIKPENIMLVHPDYSVVQVIDFGSSCLGTQHMYTYIQSRFYRSPEIVLGINYTHAIDMWSLGCMLVELHSGEPLFPAANSFDHVCRMVGVLGMPPPDVIAGAPHRAKFFEPADDAAAPPPPPPPPRLRRQRGAATAARGGDDVKDEQAAAAAAKTAAAAAALPAQFAPSGGLRLRAAPLAAWALERWREKETTALATLRDVIGVERGGPKGPGGVFAGKPGHDRAMYELFADFVARMLDYRAERRITPAQALNHPFMTAEQWAREEAAPWGIGAAAAPAAAAAAAAQPQDVEMGGMAADHAEGAVPMETLPPPPWRAAAAAPQPEPMSPQPLHDAGGPPSGASGGSGGGSSDAASAAGGAAASAPAAAARQSGRGAYCTRAAAAAAAVAAAAAHAASAGGLHHHHHHHHAETRTGIKRHVTPSPLDGGGGGGRSGRSGKAPAAGIHLRRR